jgi:hypothetical protein
LQFGWQATQLNFIGILRSSSDAGMRRIAGRGNDARQCDAKGDGAEQHPTSCCHPTSPNGGKA